MPVKYDIINKNKELKFLGKSIPISFEYEIAREYKDITTVLDYGDMAMSASKELMQMLARDYSDEDLLSIKTETRNSEKGYDVIARLILRAEVTEIKEFEYVSE